MLKSISKINQPLRYFQQVKFYNFPNLIREKYNTRISTREFRDEISTHEDKGINWLTKLWNSCSDKMVYGQNGTSKMVLIVLFPFFALHLLFTLQFCW